MADIDTVMIRDLQRSVRRLRYGFLIVLLAALILIVAGLGSGTNGSGEPTVRTSRLELVDEDGVLRGAMFVNEAGPRFMLYGEDGRKRLALSMQGPAPGLEIFTPEGRHALQVRHLNGEPIVALHDAEGHQRLILTVDGKTGEATVKSVEQEGTVRAVWPTK